MKKIASVVLISSLLLASPVYAKVNSDQIGATTTTKPATTSSSAAIKNNIFNLSDQQMKNAIKIGYSGRDSYLKFSNSQQFPILYDKMMIWQPKVSMVTPYSLIASGSYLASDAYKEYTLSDAKKTNKLFANIDVIKFSLTAYGNQIDFARGINIVLKQGANLYQPLKINGLDELGDTTTSWPNSPAYQNHLTVDFNINKVDFSKPAELIYLYAGKELSVTYKIDFSKIK